MWTSRQAIYRIPKSGPAATRRPATGTVDRAIVGVARFAELTESFGKGDATI